MKERARTFMYVSIGILALAISFQMGAVTSRADFNPVTAGNIVGGHFATTQLDTTNAHYVLLQSGDVWGYSEDYGWNQVDESYNPPIPVGEVALWDHDVLVSDSGELWVYANGWQNRGFPSESHRDESNVSQVKSLFR